PGFGATGDESAVRPPTGDQGPAGHGRGGPAGPARGGGPDAGGASTWPGSSGRPAGGAAPPQPGRTGGGRAAAKAEHRRWGLARAAIRTAPGSAEAKRAATPRAQAEQRPAVRAEPAVPWYEMARENRTAAGWRDCGSLEQVLHREWERTAEPPAEAVNAINRLADLPRLIKDRLAAGLDAIHVGGGGVPDLDDMGRLKGVPLPSGRATWDACAGAYGERKIVVGSRPSPTPDVMCHEIGHALDDIDSPPGKWQSDSAEFRAIYDQCQPFIASDFHRQRGGLGRKEFFADAFAAIASAQRPALVDMLSGNTRIALRVMLYFNRRYGI